MTQAAEVARAADPAATAAPAIALRDLEKRWGDVVAVADVTLDIADGEFFSLLGPSGSGKTTTLRMIAGFETPTAGRVLLHGQDVTGLAPYERDVNTVFQDYALFPHMTVGENVAYGLRVKRVGTAEQRERTADALAMVRLEGLADRRVTQLSGGQRQRVALARALVNRPRVLLLDEPLGALDLKLRQAMQVELKGIQREVGITFLYVTHDQEEALVMSDRLAVFNEGRVEQVGAPSDVYEHPRSAFVAGFVGVSTVFDEHAALAVTGSPEPFSVRPEKIRLAEPGAAGPADCVLPGVVRDAVYLGMHTRYLVETAVGDVVVVRQNLEESAADLLSARGRAVELRWDATFNRPLAGGPAA